MFPLSKLLTFLMASVINVNAVPRVHPGVHRALRDQGVVNLIVTMKDGTPPVLSIPADTMNRGSRIAAIMNAQQDYARVSQRAVLAVIEKTRTASEPPLAATMRSFWISNQVYFQAATDGLVSQLSALPTVDHVREEIVLPLPRVDFGNGNATKSPYFPHTNEWGIEMIQAPSVWASGNTGTNVTVASIDTGVRATHDALYSNFRDPYGWLDPENNAIRPYDNNGHGTHTMGTIVGQNGIGVAPGATWMACKGCRATGCMESDLLACAEFITCPTDTNGDNPDCSKAPHVVSNSWGGGQGSNFFQDAVDTWYRAGIIPIFSNGNSGPGCDTANSPADLANVIAVGATDATDALADFSSKGPSVTGLLKPDVSAPGVNIRSAWNTDDSSFNSISGTSMAAPHVSGLVALYLSANPGSSYDHVLADLISTVDMASLRDTGVSCGATNDGEFPNNITNKQYAHPNGRSHPSTALHEYADAETNLISYEVL